MVTSKQTYIGGDRDLIFLPDPYRIPNSGRGYATSRETKLEVLHEYIQLPACYVYYGVDVGW